MSKKHTEMVTKIKQKQSEIMQTYFNEEESQNLKLIKLNQEKSKENLNEGNHVIHKTLGY